MRVCRVGERAVLIECPGPDIARAVYAEARRSFVDATDIVPAASTVLVDGVDPAEAAGVIDGWRLSPTKNVTGPLVEVPVTYDGPDLTAVARIWGVRESEVGQIHQDCEFVVAFCGFAPGFAYCSGLPEELGVPRLADPRARVRAGSVGLAGTYTGVYPTQSPGGWRLIGRTSTELWRVDRPEPALLTPGTRVRFVDA